MAPEPVLQDALENDNLGAGLYSEHAIANLGVKEADQADLENDDGTGFYSQFSRPPMIRFYDEHGIANQEADQADQSFTAHKLKYAEPTDSDLIAKSLDISYKALDDGRKKKEAVYLDPHDWRRQGPRLLTGVQAMSALSRKNIAAREKYKEVNGTLESCRQDFLRERSYIKEWLRRLGESDPQKFPGVPDEPPDEKRSGETEDEFEKYLLYVNFPLDSITKSILLRDIRKANQHLLDERNHLRATVKRLGGGSYNGLLGILQNSGMSICPLLMMLMELCEEQREKNEVIDTATNNLRARFAAFEAKVKALELGDLPAIQEKEKQAEEATAKQQVGMEQLTQSIEKIEKEYAVMKKETETYHYEVKKLQDQEKKWIEMEKNARDEEAHQELDNMRKKK